LLLAALPPLSLQPARAADAGGDTARATVPFAVEAVKDIACGGEKRHKLDLYLPRGHKGFPVLVFAHGGGWKCGDKGDFAFLGAALAGHGVGVAAVNYRLYP
jgi:acetyl esterase/lipase